MPCRAGACVGIDVLRRAYCVLRQIQFPGREEGTGEELWFPDRRAKAAVEDKGGGQRGAYIDRIGEECIIMGKGGAGRRIVL